MAKIPIADQITCLRRELALRYQCYPGWVTLKKMTREKSDLEIGRMTAALQTLIELEKSQSPELGL